MLAESVEDALGRWAFATGIPPDVFNNPLWHGAFSAIKVAPASMPTPRRNKIAGSVFDLIYDAEQKKATASMYSDEIVQFGWSAAWDGATVHHQPIIVFVALLPTRPKPLLLKYINTSKALSIAGRKDAAIEARLFIESAKETKGKGKFLIMLCTDTPQSMRAMFGLVELTLKQLFWQPDICHCTSLSVKEVFEIPALAECMAELVLVNGFFLSSNFLICLVMRVSSAVAGRPRVMMRPCDARFAQNAFLGVNCLSLKSVLQACVFDPSYLAYYRDLSGKDKVKHDEVQAKVKDEAWWSDKLLLMSVVWPLLSVLRIGERPDNSPGKLLHAMYMAEEKLDAIIEAEEGDSFMSGLASDVLAAINRQHDGVR